MGHLNTRLDDMPDRNWCIALVLGAAVAALPTVAASESVGSGPEFGINRGALAFDGACNDPRFVVRQGPDISDPAQIFGDAADCHAAWERGEIVLRQTAHYSVSGMAAVSRLDDLGQHSNGPGDALGEDQGPWSSNGVCNDPRFTADPRWPGAVERIDDAEGKDSTDCLRANLLRQAWPIRLRLTGGEGLVFGDDSGEWAGDGECDDPRFFGIAAASDAGISDLLRDASDCYDAWSEGHVKLISPVVVLDRLPAGFDLGNDTGEWSFDGECDDPRFEGAGTAGELRIEHRARDATDCARALLNEEVDLKAPRLQDGTELSFGDDGSDWAHDGVCNDPRFDADPRQADAAARVGSAEEHDASDCRRAFLERRVWPVWGRSADDKVLAFGDDSGEWAGDGECDDPRFFGVAAARSANASSLLRDASDCYEAWSEGGITLISPVAVLDRLREVDLGNDTSEWAFDGECDDPRFEGVGVANELRIEHQARDATDCARALLNEEAGLKVPRLHDGTELSFGDDGGGWAQDGVCNDPRFDADPRQAGAVARVGNAEEHDASDCRRAFLERRVWPVWGRSADNRELAFGDDSGQWPLDGECDDPRFVGAATAESASVSDLLRDASDCYEAWIAGTIKLFSLEDASGKMPPDFDLGDDSGEWAFDGECDDPRFHGDHVASELHPENRGRDATDCGRALLNGEADITIQASQ